MWSLAALESVCVAALPFLTVCAVVQGDLSLLADKGHAGIPLGHIIAYKADHALHVEFAQALKASQNAA